MDFVWLHDLELSSTWSHSAGSVNVALTAPQLESAASDLDWSVGPTCKKESLLLLSTWGNIVHLGLNWWFHRFLVWVCANLGSNSSLVLELSVQELWGHLWKPICRLTTSPVCSIMKRECPRADLHPVTTAAAKPGLGGVAKYCGHHVRQLIFLSILALEPQGPSCGCGDKTNENWVLLLGLCPFQSRDLQQLIAVFWKDAFWDQKQVWPWNLS